VVFTAGMHGNEPAGLFALDRVLAEISESRIPIFGNVYALSGNLTALAEGKRYHRQDLNRLWTKENVSGLMSGGQHSEEDLIQQLELFRVVDEILKSAQPPFLFIDLLYA
jgi:succinylglutamate desuccinylase